MSHFGGDTVDAIERQIRIREYNEERDVEFVRKLEKNCETGSRSGVSIFSDRMGDPLCRVRLYKLHVMQVAELPENGKLVGVVRGCIKHVGTCFIGDNIKMGCILGLRVSPTHRRMGIGQKLVKSIEQWATAHGADYTLLATEENNVASKNLFTQKRNYSKVSNLVIFCQPIVKPFPTKGTNLIREGIKIEKMQIDQAVIFYRTKLVGRKDIYPVDIDTILKEKPSLGTWVSCFKDEDWISLYNNNMSMPSSWAVFSIWNTCENHKVHVKHRSLPLNCFHAPLSCAKERKPFGFLFLYGVLGEGERLREIVSSMWSFASRLAKNVKHCGAIITELGISDPFTDLVPTGPTISYIEDIWCLKKVYGPTSGEDELKVIGQVGNVFIDPRDF